MPQSNKKISGVVAKGCVFRRLLQLSLSIWHKYPNRDKNHWFSKLIILGRVWTKVCLWDKGRWCLEVFHEYFEYFLFVKHQIVLIDEEDDMEVIFATTSKAEEGEAPNIINKDQDTERASWLEGNIKNLPLVLTGGRTINSEDVVELWCIGMTVVEDKIPWSRTYPMLALQLPRGFSMMGMCG